MSNYKVRLLMIGWYLIITSLSAIAGRLTGVRWLYDFGDKIGMAYATASSLIVVGIGFLLIVNREK